MKIPALSKINSLPPFIVGDKVKTNQGKEFLVSAIIQVYKEDQDGLPSLSWDLVLIDTNPDSHTFEN